MFGFFRKKNIINYNVAKVEKLKQEGIKYFEEGKYDNAIECYNKAIELAPCDSKLYTYRATSKMCLNLLDDVIADCNAAIKADSKNAYAYRLLSSVYFLLKEYEKSIKCKTKHLRLSPIFLPHIITRQMQCMN